MSDLGPLLSGALTAAAVLLLRRPRAPLSMRRAWRAGDRWHPGRWRRPAGVVAAPVPTADAGLPGAVEVAVLAEQIAGLVRAGLPAGRVWRAVADRAASPAVRSAAAAVLTGHHRGESAAAALRVHLAAAHRAAPPGRPGALGAPVRRAAGRRHGGDGGALRQLVVALDVSERTGAAPAVTLLRLAEALRLQETAAVERDSALAGPRASAVVLSLLPLAGLALGGLLGGDPLRVLLLTSPGRGCLLVGGLLWTAGRVWTVLLVRRAAAAS